MDLLCTENIMNDLENELLYQHLQQKQQQEIRNQIALNNYRIQNTNVPIATNTATAIVTSTASHSATSSPIVAYNASTSTSSSPICSSNSSASSVISSASSAYYSKTSTLSNVSESNATKYCSNSSNHSSSTESSSAFVNDAELAQRNSRYICEQQQQQLQYQQQQHNVYTSNLINRSLDYVNTATADPTFLTDRCLENALKTEEKRPQPVCTYFKTIQKDITPPMRKIVAEWMMELCAEEKCQGEVVLLAISYMDRFLLTKSVRKTHLQILASACLLLASKLREPSCRALSAELLVFYTDNSIYKGDLIKWELFVLSRLGWDLSTVTPLDFLELLLIRLPIKSKECPDLDVDKVRQHAQAFISLAAKEHYFSMYSASTIAASSIAAALSGLNWHLRAGHNLRYLLNRLTDLTSVDQEYLHDCMMKMEAIFEEHSRNLQPYLVSVDAQHQHQKQQQHQQQHQQQQQQCTQKSQQQQQKHMQQHSNNNANNNISLSHSGNNNNSSNGTITATVILPDLTQTCKMQANAQKDIQDIKF